MKIRLYLLLIALITTAACPQSPDPKPDAGMDMSKDTTKDVEEDTSDTSPDMTSKPVIGADDLPIPEGCNPIAFEHDCLFPYPSNAFLVDDANTPTKKTIKLTGAAVPTSRRGGFDFMKTHPVDGFSFHQPIMTLFPEGVSTDNLSFHDTDPAASVLATSPTLLIDAKTGEAIPHWAELDRNTEETDKQTFILRTWAPLKEQTRYIVAFQGLQDASGKRIEPPRGFAEVRDADASAHPVLGPLQARYDSEIFPILTNFGLERSNIQLAWDFTTQSQEYIERDMLDIRAHLLVAMDTAPPAVTVTSSTTEGLNDEIAYRLEGTLEVPLFLESEELGAALHRDTSGKVVQNGTIQVPFVLQISKSAMPDAPGYEPRRIVQYGHGFFGLREEINYSAARDFVSKEGHYILAAVDWMGMAEYDVPDVIKNMAQDTSRSFVFVDRIHQGLANQMALARALKTTIAALPEMQVQGQTVYDASELYYYGISQGHILGGVLHALSPDITRAILQVGGAPYSFMMSRSQNFRQFLGFIELAVRNPVTVQKFITLCQHTFDRVSSITFAPYILKKKLPGNSDKQILLQAGVGDLQVHNLSTEIHARALGVPLIEPSLRMVPELPTTTDPQNAGLTFVDFGIQEEVGRYNITPGADDETVAHEGVRRNGPIRQQIEKFFRPDGVIEHPCDGPCDPE